MAQFQFEPSGSPSIDEIVRHWPEKPAGVARIIADRYGAPDEWTRSMFVWYNNTPWKRTVVYRDETQHNFPAPHTDVIEQTINYHIPMDRVTDVIAFNGSIIIDRTRGEVSARCGREEINFLTLNLMNDIVKGRMNVEEARAEFGRRIEALVNDLPSPYMEGFQFDPPRKDTADRDHPTIDEAAIDIYDILNLNL